MAQSSLEQLQLLSDKIQDEEMSFIIDQMAKALLNTENGTTGKEDPRKETEREKCASLLLRSMRIHLCLDLIKQGHSSCVENLKKDWGEIIDCLQFMECTWKVTDELLWNAVDIILLLDPSNRSDLLRLLDIPAKHKNQKPLPFLVVDCAFQMAEYCLQTNRSDELFRIIANLISLSEERNIVDLNKHRFLIAKGLYYIVDNDHQLTVQIGTKQRKYFDNIVSKSACHFYWFYAFALLQTGCESEAAHLFKHCHELCIEFEGDSSWIGVRAGSLYHYHLLLSGETDRAEPYLWESLARIESGFYRNMDETADFIAASTRSILLKYRQDQQMLQGLLSEIERLLDYCISAEEINLSPYLTVRYAENTLAAYYLESGDYLQAADHSRKALDSIPPNGLPKYPSDFFLYSNLLEIYTALNDPKQISNCMQQLSEMSDDHEDDYFAMSRIACQFNTIAMKDPFRYGDLKAGRHELYDFYLDICHSEIKPYPSDMENVAYAQWILNLCASVLDSFTAEPKELIQLRKIAAYFMERSDIYKFNNIQKCSYFTLMTQIEFQLGSPKALHYLDKSLQFLDYLAPSREASISILRFAALVYNTDHRQNMAISMVDKCLSGITAAWQKAATYLNDRRVCQLLSFTPIHFNICYSILRTCAYPKSLYERVLQFKDLPALVGRERNKLLRLAPVDEQLKEQIFAKQDQLAAAELNDSLNGTNSAQDIAVQLEHLEAQFAAQFPQNLYFTEITFTRVCENLPDNSAIVEYYFALGEKALCRGPYENDAWELDIFITTKRNGVPKLDYIKVEHGDIILDQATKFVNILQNPDDASVSGEKATLRGDLYCKLIAPVLPFLGGISNLYIAPDNQLCNLPFEILYAEGSGLLQDKFKVCRLVSGRDLLFYDDHGPTEGTCFILGDPNYESERGEISHSNTRGSHMSLEPVDDLPFSNIEATRIGQRCRSRIYTGDAATKYSLQDALPCSIIHLATHGVFDENLETDSLYSSHLVFAGYNKWVSNKTESSYCGNGVLTADEISRMDLKKTELVVLSTCQSGMGDISYGSVRGLLSAFSAAGARWVITHMWEANDFSTPILMDAFYDAWLNKENDIPDALRYAKNYLRTATIGTLRQNGWLSPPSDARISEDILTEINDMKNWPDDIMPFEDEYFWGGFTVHKTR